MPVRKPLVLLATVLLVLTVALSQDSTFAARSSSPGVVCNHPRGLDDAKPLAKAAWQRAYGPNKSQRRNWKIIKVCARTNYQREVRFPNLWAKYKSLYSSDRKVQRLKFSCEDHSGSYVVRCIKYASVVHSYPLSTLVRIATCESHLNPAASNSSGASGLFQFMVGTFNNAVARMRADGYDNGGDIWDAGDNATAAAYKMSHDGTGEWSCQ